MQQGTPKRKQNLTIGAIAGLALAVGVIAVPGVPAAWADPPGGFAHGRGHDRGDEDRGRGSERDARRGDEHGHGERGHEGRHFQDRDRVVVREYFVEHERGGRCPPGLAKKHDGCVPPGHARRWALGRPLPRDVVYYELPPQLVVQLTPPPAGYRYVRVASDILMIAAGTGMVAEAIEDLSR